MLAIRFLRSGRTNQAFFRVVLTQKSNPPKSKFIKIFGWYNPKTKETSLNKEEILQWVDKGAKPSNSVAKLLIANKITHKHIVYIPDAPGKKKAKGEIEKQVQPNTDSEQDTAKEEGEIETENQDEKEAGDGSSANEKDDSKKESKTEDEVIVEPEAKEEKSKDDQTKE